MATTYKRLASYFLQRDLVTTTIPGSPGYGYYGGEGSASQTITETTMSYKLVYTVPENTGAIIKNIFATNHNDFPVSYDLIVVPESDLADGISEKHHYISDSLIDSNEYDNIKSRITLSAGDEVYIYSSTDENISFNIFGAEIA